MADRENPFIGSRVMRYGYAGGQTRRQRELKEAPSCSLCRLVEKDIQFITYAEGFIKKIQYYKVHFSVQRQACILFLCLKGVCVNPHTVHNT